MISVCLLARNGEKYIKEQIDSILSQLDLDDELIISDDGSTDRTCAIILGYKDNRVRLLRHQSDENKFKGTMAKCFNVGRNAENALKHAKGDYIFLSDQDDIWLPNKVHLCCEQLNDVDLVITNHIPVDADLKYLVKPDEISLIEKPTLINTLLRTQFLGCCMAFNKRLMQYILPFPKQPLMHDIWIGLMALKHGKIGLLQDPYILYRRHSNNASVNVGQKSTNSLQYKLKYRLYLLQAYLNN